MPKVSVIIPIYNVEEYLPQTVQSVLEQTEGDIEIILVDDGSTDGSGALCDTFARSDQRVRVIHQENGGLSSARNAGVKIARSDYILLVDGDDRLHHRAVARLLAVMEETPVDFVQFRYREVSAQGMPEEAAFEGPPVFSSGPASLFENLYRLGGEGASACTKLFRRELLERIPFEPIRHEDEMWCSRAFSESLTVAYIPDELYYYVMRENSIIHSIFNDKRMDIFEISEERIKTLEKLELDCLLHFEYDRIFLFITQLYCEAKDAGHTNALKIIKEKFSKHKKNIQRYASLKGGYRILFKLMYVNYNVVEVYRLYRKSGS